MVKMFIYLSIAYSISFDTRIPHAVKTKDNQLEVVGITQHIYSKLQNNKLN